MRQTSDRQTPIDLTGMLLPWNHETGQPVLTVLEEITFLTIFSSPEKLIGGLQIIGLHWDIKQIEDGTEFLESVKGQVRIMLDPWITEEGNTRFLEIPNGR